MTGRDDVCRAPIFAPHAFVTPGNTTDAGDPDVAADLHEAIVAAGDSGVNAYQAMLVPLAGADEGRSRISAAPRRAARQSAVRLPFRVQSH